MMSLFYFILSPSIYDAVSEEALINYFSEFEIVRIRVLVHAQSIKGAKIQ